MIFLSYNDNKYDIMLISLCRYSLSLFHSLPPCARRVDNEPTMMIFWLTDVERKIWIEFVCEKANICHVPEGNLRFVCCPFDFFPILPPFSSSLLRFCNSRYGKRAPIGCPYENVNIAFDNQLSETDALTGRTKRFNVDLSASWYADEAHATISTDAQ